MYGLKRDFITSYLVVFKKFSLSGLFFFDENTDWWKSRYLGYCVLVLSTIFWVFHARGLVSKYLAHRALSKISTELAGFLTLTEGITNLIHLFWSRKPIINFLRQLDSEWQNDSILRPEQATEKNKIIEKFDKALNRYLAVINMNQIVYMAAPMVMNLWNAAVHGHFTRELPFSIDLGFDYKTNLAVFLCVYMFDAYLLFCACWMIVAPVWLIAITMRNLYVMFVTFRHDIREQVNKADHHNIKADMQALLGRHTTLLNLQNDLSGPFGAIFAIHVGILITIIAFSAITAMLERDATTLTDAFICLLASVNLLPICYYGEQLTDSSVEVATAVYDTAWYNIDIKYQKWLLLMMYRSQQPSYITSTFLTNISIITFTNVIKSTWSFFSLILTMTEN